MKKQITIYTVNNKAVKILQKYTYTYLVEFIKSGKISSVNKNFVKSFKKTYNAKNINQLKFDF